MHCHNVSLVVVLQSFNLGYTVPTDMCCDRTCRSVLSMNSVVEHAQKGAKHEHVNKSMAR